ncbi:unnamed protein product [Paramecium octaurelia]|uniref:Uncharacterized protein n=1 Tax=Paramecium octaurelia TaxID=43137 RepID=A0A8S1X9T5_PAROT|nr:unnamed protein product [Paramecium octaurelia]
MEFIVKNQRTRSLNHCLILKNNEDFLFLVVQLTQLSFGLTITDHTNYVYQIDLNEEQDKVSSCGQNNRILENEYSVQNKAGCYIIYKID